MQPEYIQYHSQNRLLIIGSEPTFDQLPVTLTADFQLFWLTDAASTSKAGTEILTLTADESLNGFLGNFTLKNHPHYQFDLVLDFQEPPAIASPIPPFGYYPVTDADRLHAALAELPDMTGVFDKPKYFVLDTTHCAHQNNSITGCHRCIDVCATQAIRSEHGQIEVNPYLCQGCGDCSSVCPSGAIRYQYPDLKSRLTAIKTALAEAGAGIESAKALVLHQGECPNDLPDYAILFQLEALGVADLALCLNAIAFGANQVIFSLPSELTSQTRQTLNDVIEQGNRLLAALGLGDHRIQMTSQTHFKILPPHTVEPATYQPENDKRRALRMATEHIGQFSQASPESCALPASAGFGTLHIDINSCTLCLSCVSICPNQALQSGQDLPQLKFIEANCLQCNLCQTACPEHAITREPRYLFDSVQAKKPRLLHEEKPFLCINCQKPFASASMINAIVQKLQHHPMFQGERKQHLLLCEDCKIAAHFNQSDT